MELPVIKIRKFPGKPGHVDHLRQDSYAIPLILKFFLNFAFTKNKYP